jgi:hypothetical protein
MRSSFLVIRTDANYGMADDRMRKRIAALVPHLQRAVAIGRLFDRSQAAERLLTETLDRVEAAVFLVGADGAISFANDPASKMLAEATLMRKDGDALHAVAADTDRILHDIFAAAKRGDASVGVRGVAVPLADASSDPWFAHVLPLTSAGRQATGRFSRDLAGDGENASSQPVPQNRHQAAERARQAGGGHLTFQGAWSQMLLGTGNDFRTH